MVTNFGAYDQYYLAGIVVGGTYLAVVFLLWLLQRSVLAPRIASFRGIAPNFLTAINVLFALNLAFLANDTWNAHDRALNAVFQEAGSLRNIIDFADNLPDPVRTRIDGAVSDYARAVVDEWPMLARRESSRTAADRLDALLALLSGDAVVSAANPGIQSQMLQQAIDVRGSRVLRVALSQTHVNPLKWLGMAFLGFLTMISIAMIHVDQPRAEALAVLLFATAAAPTAAIVLVHGNPFQQPMAVSAAPIAAIADTLPTSGAG
jgi:hypothetical protein